jgi:hypothetical protein
MKNRPLTESEINKILLREERLFSIWDSVGSIPPFKKEKEDNMSEILVLAQHNRNTGAETLIGFFEDEDSVQAALKELVTFRFDGTDVAVARDFHYRVHRFKTNVRIITEALPKPEYDHDDIQAYYTVFSSNKRDTYGVAVNSAMQPVGCTCKSWEMNNHFGDSCKHMAEVSNSLVTALGQQNLGWNV